MKTVIMDIDETVLYSRSQVPGSVAFRFMDEPFDSYTIERPSAREFLTVLESEGYDLRVMTSGLVEFQIEALKQVYLLDFFNEISGYVAKKDVDGRPLKGPYGRVALKGALKPLDQWLLVDNLHSRDWNLADKRSWLGVDSFAPNQHVHCESFYGLEAPQDSLLLLLPEIRKKLK